MAEYAYMGRETCGCVTCVTVDNPEYKKYVAKDLSDWIRQGLSVERVPIEEARQAITFDCPHQTTAV